MPRSIRSAQLETRTARLKLTAHRKPYWVSVSPGVGLGYRAGPGTWNVRAADGKGGNWIKSFALADDHEEADGENVLTYWAAIDIARAIARGRGADNNRPATVGEAIDDYEKGCVVRGAAITNATRVRHHLTPQLAAKPVALLTARDLRRWRDDLLTSGVAAATVNRTARVLKAALNAAAAHDPRISNRDAWRIGLAAVPDANHARNVVLDDRQVRALLAAAYEVAPAFGLWVELHLAVGARPSQTALLEVGDLQGGPNPRLLMPSSRKGRNRAQRVRRPVPVSHALFDRLVTVAAGRAATEPLLLRPDGGRWRPEVTDHARLFADAAGRAGLTGVTAYSMRHTCVTNAILAGVPVRVCAALFDTSIGMIEAAYSKYISDHSDQLIRSALFKDDAPAALGNNVVALR